MTSRVLFVFSCRDVAERASDYLDRDLSLRSRLQFRLHLFLCRDCRRYIDQLGRMPALLRSSLKRTAAMQPAAEEQLLAAVRARAEASSLARDA